MLVVWSSCLNLTTRCTWILSVLLSQHQKIGWELGFHSSWQLPVPALPVDAHQQSSTTSLMVLQEQQQEAEALAKAGRVMCNVKLAAAWRGWLAVVDQRHHLKAKLGSALNLFVNRRLTLGWQAWKVNPGRS